MTSARLDSVSSIATFRLAIYVVILTLTYMLWQVGDVLIDVVSHSDERIGILRILHLSSPTSAWPILVEDYQYTVSLGNFQGSA